MKIMIALFLFAAAAPAAAQPIPPPGAPGYPMVQGPVLAIPVLEADFRAKAGSEIVRFARDSYVLTPQSQATLTAQAQWLIQHPFVRASIEGHADGRQTREYSLALGERRAAAVPHCDASAPQRLLPGIASTAASPAGSSPVAAAPHPPPGAACSSPGPAPPPALTLSCSSRFAPI